MILLVCLTMSSMARYIPCSYSIFTFESPRVHICHLGSLSNHLNVSIFQTLTALTLLQAAKAGGVIYRVREQAY